MCQSLLQSFHFALGLLGQAAPEAATGTGDPRPYIFWAYSLVCVLLFLFHLWTWRQARKLSRRIEYLEERWSRSQVERKDKDAVSAAKR
jgi:hypothetical protein